MNALLKITALSLWIGFLAAGCGDGDDTGTTPENTTQVRLVAGTQTVCPIMGNPIVEDSFTDYNGKRIYFCCAGCDSKFNEDPEKFIKQMEDAGVVLTRIIEK